jgi:hypothetical protein
VRFGQSLSSQTLWPNDLGHKGFWLFLFKISD